MKVLTQRKESGKQSVENKAKGLIRQLIEVSKKMGLHFYEVLQLILKKSGSGGQALFTLGEYTLQKISRF